MDNETLLLENDTASDELEDEDMNDFSEESDDFSDEADDFDNED